MSVFMTVVEVSDGGSRNRISFCRDSDSETNGSAMGRCDNDRSKIRICGSLVDYIA